MIDPDDQLLEELGKRKEIPWDQLLNLDAAAKQVIGKRLVRCNQSELDRLWKHFADEAEQLRARRTLLLTERDILTGDGEG